VSDTWIFGVANFGADLLHCFGHPSRFGDRNNVVVGSMKDPDGHGKLPSVPLALNTSSHSTNSSNYLIACLNKG
jgi:hypothetical protein